MFAPDFTTTRAIGGGDWPGRVLTRGTSEHPSPETAWP